MNHIKELIKQNMKDLEKFRPLVDKDGLQKKEFVKLDPEVINLRINYKGK